jgi:hypothetical protein
LKPIDHGTHYELCGLDSPGELFDLSDALKDMEDKPIFFTLDWENKEPLSFYRKLIETGRIELVRLVFRKVK